MNTPIYDFVKRYTRLRPARFHMPGHKGRGPLGCEGLDLTEIPGADSLYEAAGIIAESEANASALFGCPTFYSTEGSSHCIRAMLLLAAQASGNRQQASGDGVRGRGFLAKAFPLGGRCHPASPASRMTDEGRDLQRAATGDGGCGSFDSAALRSGRQKSNRFRVLAARNCHRAFLSAAALLDLDVVWLPPEASAEGEGGSYLSAQPTPEALDAALAETGAGAVYLTCPDYLGFLPDLAPLAAVCHAHGALLLVDNAHGAYLRFLTPSRHPMDLGADLCCDSAHKTLPVLTGGAYLHVAQALVGDARRDGTLPSAPSQAEERRTSTACPYEARGKTRPLRKEDVRDALALFGSTSPSYLILQSLDLANPDLETLPEKLAGFLPKAEALKGRLRAAGWTVVGDEPLKVTLALAHAFPLGGRWHGEAVTDEGTFRQAEAPNHPAGASEGPSSVIGLAGDARCHLPPWGKALAAALEQAGIFCEFADPDYIVFMLSPENTDGELERLEEALTGSLDTGDGSLCCQSAAPDNSLTEEHREPSPVSPRYCSLREAMFSPALRVPAGESLGRVLARPGVSCPPAVPILMPGEVIDEAAIEAFGRYGIEEIEVLPYLFSSP